MLQKVLKVGTSAAITIPKKSLEELGIAIGDKVYVTVDEEERVVTIQSQRSPKRRKNSITKRQEKIAELTFNFIERYRPALEALAKK